MHKKSASQLRREIDDVLARPASSARPRLRRGSNNVRLYEIEARIISGIDDEAVWEGTLELPARSLKAARTLALGMLHESYYYDPRIDAYAVIDRAEHIGEAEASPPETAESLTAELISVARRKIP